MAHNCAFISYISHKECKKTLIGLVGFLVWNME